MGKRLVLLNMKSLVVSIIVIAALSFSSSCGIIEDRKYNDIYEDVRPVVGECMGLDDSAISIRGKVLIFDPQFGSRGWTPSTLLGKELRASYEDKEITVFVIKTERLDRVGYYDPNFKGWAAYRARYDICVIYWPKRKPVGRHTIFSDPPPYIKVRGSGTPGELGRIGNIEDVIRWIENLPRT